MYAFKHTLASRPKTDSCSPSFINGANSRSRLKISREMLTLIFTYLQVMPVFLDFLFPLGQQWFPQDLYYSGFRYEVRLTEYDKSPGIEKLNRSGKSFQLCYGLKSAEIANSGVPQEWSVRHSALHLYFDISTGYANWVLVKGNDLLRKRLEDLQVLTPFAKRVAHELCGRPSEPRASTGKVSESFAASLRTHLLFCDWSAENWRWYLNFLDDQLQESTRHWTSIILESSPAPRVTKPPTVHRKLTGLESTHTQAMADATITNKNKQTTTNKSSQTQVSSPTHSPPPPPLSIGGDIGNSHGFTPSDPSEAYEQISYDDVQKIESLREITGSVLLHLEMNVDITQELEDFYENIIKDPDFQDHLDTSKSLADMAYFIRRLRGIRKDTSVQLSRAKTLLNTVNGRRDVLFEMLEYRNMMASKQFGLQAQRSAFGMSVMTESIVSMHKIAKRTGKETVSMKVITLVTLFFLPGTFIAV